VYEFAENEAMIMAEHAFWGSVCPMSLLATGKGVAGGTDPRKNE